MYLWGVVSKILIRRLGLGLLLMALLLLPRSTRAHTPDLSLADFDVQADGHVEGALTFSSAELLGFPLDRDRDGVVTADDVSAAGEELRALLLQGVEVDADGSPCRATFRDASLTEVDGLVLRANYACPSETAEIEVTLYYLSALPRGRATSPKRGIARIVAGSATAEGLLTGEHRAIRLRLPGRADTKARRRSPVALSAAAAVVIALFAYRAIRSRRWRAARAACQNRES
jgi:hypothetical protein